MWYTKDQELPPFAEEQTNPKLFDTGTLFELLDATPFIRNFRSVFGNVALIT